ncbi:MAG: hypothetical protein H7836_12340 [Magnetococcus sp. YQC-3]
MASISWRLCVWYLCGVVGILLPGLLEAGEERPVRRTVSEGKVPANVGAVGGNNRAQGQRGDFGGSATGGQEITPEDEINISECRRPGDSLGVGLWDGSGRCFSDSIRSGPLAPIGEGE